MALCAWGLQSWEVAAAARLLANTERVVRESYANIEAGEVAQEATEAFEHVDGTGHRETERSDEQPSGH